MHALLEYMIHFICSNMLHYFLTILLFGFIGSPFMLMPLCIEELMISSRSRSYDMHVVNSRDAL